MIHPTGESSVASLQTPISSLSLVEYISLPLLPSRELFVPFVLLLGRRCHTVVFSAMDIPNNP